MSDRSGEIERIRRKIAQLEGEVAPLVNDELREAASNLVGKCFLLREQRDGIDDRALWNHYELVVAVTPGDRPEPIREGFSLADDGRVTLKWRDTWYHAHAKDQIREITPEDFAEAWARARTAFLVFGDNLLCRRGKGTGT